MILAIDMGNTNITLGCYKGDRLLFVSRMYTERHKTSDEFAVQMLELFRLHNVSPSDFSGAVLSSVVPQLTDIIAQACELTIKKTPVIVGAEHHGSLKVEVLPVSALGADLIADCVGAMKKYPLPCLVIDLGTASKILAIDSDGYFLGCAIAPGVKLSLDALAEGAALLPSISFTKPAHAVGTNTAECMQSGSVFGTAAMLDGMTKRMLSELGVKKAAIVATGGLAKGIVTCCETEIIYDENLILDGIKAIYDESRGDLL